MSISGTLKHVYYEAKGNKWFHYFAVFCRVTLAVGFIISGLVKITGERFASGLFAMIAAVIIINQFLYSIRPGNSLIECTNGCAGNSNPKACLEFCNCIHNQGKTLNECLIEYNKAKAKEKNQ